MKRIQLLLCLIGCAVLLIAQNSIATLSLAHIEETHVQQGSVIQNDTVVVLDYQETITGLSISGTATLNNISNSLVRVTLQDDYNTEWLVYELFPLLADSSTVTFSNVAFETSVLENITAKQLNVTIINATLTLSDINTSNQAVASFSTLQNRAMEAQSSYIIDKLNENLEKKNIPWRAGETSVSQKTYEEKKAMFGGEVPYLGGLEYYKGGIFVMPGYESQGLNDGIATASVTSATEEEDPYVKEWDWRNRHGKNWMTPVKNQGECGACAIFAALGVLESYANIYYNQLVNLDLSEQEIVSCHGSVGCGKRTIKSPFVYVRNFGVIDELSFPYTATAENCEDKSEYPTERITIYNYQPFMSDFYSERELKALVQKHPLSFGLPMHFVTLVGYKEVKMGNICIDEYFDSINIDNSSPLIGTTVWIIKNSWGENWGEDGYANIVMSWSDMKDIYYITDNISSLNYNEEDIVIKDSDVDGYYTWGLRERPDSLPKWIPEIPDGDDSNPNYGPIDQYGHIQEIILGPTIEIETKEYWSEDNYLYNNIIIANEGSLTISSDIILHKDACVVVENGGELIIDNGCIRQADITLKTGASMIVKDNGKIILGSYDDFISETGATLTIYSGGFFINNK